MATLNSATEQSYRLQQPSRAGKITATVTSNVQDSFRPPATFSEKITISQPVITELQPKKQPPPLAAPQQGEVSQFEEQQQHQEELEAARKAREEQEARAEAARKAREEKLEAERKQQEEQLEQLNELQRKIDLGLYDATKADLIAKEYQAISKSFTIGSILSPDIDLDSVDLYA